MSHMEPQLPPVGPRIVRAWFDTLLNPLIAALESEAQLLAQRNFTWRFRPAGFERVRTVSQHLDSLGGANLIQFRAVYRDFNALFRDHDEQVERLRISVSGLHAAVARSVSLAELMKDALSQESLREIGVHSVADLFGAYPVEDRAMILAQYIVNQTGLLQSHYATGKLWNRRRDEFLHILDVPPFSREYASTVQIADKLSIFDGELLDRLNDLRLSLSLSSDQPFVAPDVDAQQRWRDPA
jgi:DNA-binding transcriptional ArsR family regulator